MWRLYMRIPFPSLRMGRYHLLALGVVLLALLFGIFNHVDASTTDQARDGRLVTIHDRGEEKVILTHAQTVRDALKDAHIPVVSEDKVEPRLDSQLVATDYTVNIYRARPVIVVDGVIREKVMTAAQTPEGITAAAGISLRDEDRTTLAASSDVVADGAGEILTIDRATQFTLSLYGTAITAYSQERTVGKMLAAKGIHLAPSDTLSVSSDTPLTAGMTVAIWREGEQTTTVKEDIPFPVRQIQDLDHPVGWKHVKTPGVNGKKSVTYEITMRGGKEIGRKTIQTVVLQEPKEQVEIVGAKMPVVTTPSQNRDLTWQFLISKGLSREQVAGIMGNLMQEHGFNTSGDGLAQWTGSRKANLLARENPYTIQTQLEFLWYELSGPYSKVLNNIRATNDTIQATRIFQNQFERCGACAETMRINYALAILGEY